MKAIEKIKLLKEHAELVQSIPAMKAVQRIKSLKRLSEIIVALGGAITSSEPEYNPVNHRGKTDIDTLFEVATSRGGGNHSFANLAKVTDETAQKIKNVLGVDVTGFDIGIDESSIRHVLKEHGDPEVERKRGQTAIVEQDFALVAEIVNNADEISKGDVDNTIVFEKKIGVDYVVVEELRIGKGKLSLKTMYKKGLTSVLIAPDKHQSIAETSETVGSLAHEQSITETNGNFNIMQEYFNKKNADTVTALTSQAVAEILVNEYGWQYNGTNSITLGRYVNDKFGEFTVSADVKDDDIIANQPLTNVFIGGVRDVVQDAQDFHQRAVNWLDSYQSKPVGNENEPNNGQNMNNPNYTQSDIDYLQSIINGTLDLEMVDMDKMIEIGEKDEHDPMYEQALQIISDYEDEMTKDI